MDGKSKYLLFEKAFSLPPPPQLMCTHSYASGFRFYRKQCNAT